MIHFFRYLCCCPRRSLPAERFLPEEPTTEKEELAIITDTVANKILNDPQWADFPLVHTTERTISLHVIRLSFEASHGENDRVLLDRLSPYFPVARSDFEVFEDGLLATKVAETFIQTCGYTITWAVAMIPALSALLYVYPSSPVYTQIILGVCIGPLSSWVSNWLGMRFTGNNTVKLSNVQNTEQNHWRKLEKRYQAYAEELLRMGISEDIEAKNFARSFAYAVNPDMLDRILENLTTQVLSASNAIQPLIFAIRCIRNHHEHKRAYFGSNTQLRDKAIALGYSVVENVVVSDWRGLVHGETKASVEAILAASAGLRTPRHRHHSEGSGGSAVPNGSPTSSDGSSTPPGGGSRKPFAIAVKA
jgi:hypothetical protein